MLVKQVFSVVLERICVNYGPDNSCIGIRSNIELLYVVPFEEKWINGKSKCENWVLERVSQEMSGWKVKSIQKV